MTKLNSGRKKHNKIKTTNYSLSTVLIKKVPFIILTGLFIYLCVAVNHIQDDAFITFRYVKNIIEGNGLVFNPGERVEGYTNFLWTMILTIPAYLKIDIIDVSQFLSVFFGVLILLVTYLITKQTIEKMKPPENSPVRNAYFQLLYFLPVLMLIFTGAYNYWAVSGMETTMFIFFNIAAVLFYLKNNGSKSNKLLVPIFLAMSALTRPEGYLFFGLICIHKTISLIYANRKTAPYLLYRIIFSRNNILAVSFFLVPVILHTGFRLYYYGNIFPNTFYAKANFSYASFVDGIAYLKIMCKDYLLYGAFLVLPLISFKEKEIHFELSIMYLLISVYSIYVIIIGGDVLPLHRFWLPILPFIYILWTVTVIKIVFYLHEGKIGMRIPLTIFIILITPCISAYNYFNNNEKVLDYTSRENNLVEQFQNKAEIINKLETAKNRRLVIAVSTIGALSYYTDAIIIDMLGLTDEYIAHHPETIAEISNDPEISWKEKRYNPEYVVGRKPDYIFFSTGSKPSAYSERALFTVKDFFAEYYNQFIPTSLGKFTYVYARKTNDMIRKNNPSIMTEKIDPLFIGHYVNMIQDLGLYRDKEKVSLVTLKNEFDSAIKSSPAFFSEPYRIMGDASFIARNYDAAREYYDKALNADSLNILSYYGMCHLYQKLGEQEKTDILVNKINEFSLIDYSLYPNLDLSKVFSSGVRKQ